MEILAGQENGRRLIVLVPAGMDGSADLAREVHQVAARENLPAVLYLMLVEDNAQALAVSRDITTLKAVTAGKALAVEAVQAAASGWLEALRAHYQRGDVILCQAEHSVRSGLFRAEAVHGQITRLLAAPVRVMSGLAAQQRKPRSLKSEMTLWSGFLAITGVFTWLEIQLNRSVGGDTGRLLLICVLVLALGTTLWSWRYISY